MIKNKKGSSLVFAVIVIMIIMVTIAAALGISYSNYNRSLSKNIERQVYLSAKSVLTNIVDEIIISRNVDYLALIPDGDELEKTKTYELKSYPQELGTINPITISRTKKTIDEKPVDYLTISVTAVYGNKTKTINADLMKLETEQEWSFLKYYEGEIPVNINIANATALLKQMKEINDAYLKKPEYFNADVKKILLEDNKEAYERVLKANSAWKYGYSNSILREYFYYGYYNGTWPKFDKKVVNKSALENDKVNEFLNQSYYYIQPFFTNKSYKTCIVYASNSTALNSWTANVQLIFNNEDGHWYYLYQPIAMTNFDDSSKPNTSDVIWQNFIKTTLNDSSKAVRLD